jgi:hypothetical protein
MIFPRIEESQAAADSCLESKVDTATLAFLDLLRWFRIVLLQDAVFLMKLYPTLSIWLYPPFNTPAFASFSTHLQHEAEHGDDPRFVQIAKVLPQMSSILRDQHHNLLHTMDIHQNINGTRMEELHALLNTCVGIIKPWSHIVNQLSSPGLVARTVLSIDPQDPSCVTPNSASGPPLPRIRNNPANQPSSTTSRSVSPSVQPPSTQSLVPSHALVPQYRLNPKVLKVTQLWEEFDQGFIPGPGMPRGPVIRDLDIEYGTKWRTAGAERKAYFRRARIWEAVINASANLDLLPETVAEKIQRYQENEKISLHKLNERLIAIKAGEPGLWGIDDVKLLNIV